HRSLRRSGLTLVEVTLVISVVGVLLAVFIPTFVRELRTSKISEAATQLEALHRASAAYYAARHDIGEASRATRCLPVPGGPVPATPSADPIVVDFSSEDLERAAPFRALGFAPVRPLRYRYTYTPIKDGCDVRATEGRRLLTLRAEGDLDEDGKYSLFERLATSNAEGELVPLGVLQVTNRTE
ncbi:MAG: type II secretion system protein, partial [Deltaproteobacteria bacterium]|nr:type II secretion system protein [Deltaproteobacteria bacterium]